MALGAGIHCTSGGSSESDLPDSDSVFGSIPMLESIPIPESDSGPTIRNRFQKTAELAGIDSDKNFIFPITTLYYIL